MKLNKNFPDKIFLDKRVLVNGKKKNDNNLENHLELSEWIQYLCSNNLIKDCYGGDIFIALPLSVYYTCDTILQVDFSTLYVSNNIIPYGVVIGNNTYVYGTEVLLNITQVNINNRFLYDFEPYYLTNQIVLTDYYFIDENNNKIGNTSQITTYVKYNICGE